MFEQTFQLVSKVSLLWEIK